MNFATFDLNLLRILDALLTEGSTVKAGEKLAMSQSAVSGALSRLRFALNDELFVRRGNRLVATDYAAAMAVELRTHLRSVEAMLSPPRAFQPAKAQGIYRIAGSDFFAEILMPQLARRLRQEAPGLKVQLVDLVPASYVTSLEQYRADLALIPDTEVPDWIEKAPAFHSSFAVIARKGHPAIAAGGIRPGQVLPLDIFCSLGHVLFSPEGNLEAMGDAALARVGRKRDVLMTLPVFSGVARAVSESDLVALVPRQLGENLARGTSLDLFVPPTPIEPTLMIGAWHRKSGRNPLHIWFRSLVMELLRPLNESEAPLPAWS
ncbi:DNA-binding transcriptional LysR family regulator [Hoeflea marina]|uniref:DNA-binding transcriptional LysR family regulator n=1 Tax=Hoeflea marina TaxID=274592 RepID=A0A317PGH7_9HYPH|nr:LysR family transcriptional regulator [Hoeflea marina]PWV98762.1 DNA-binding transcriptional LysR family regulator [Hoeflea marina]